MAVHWSGVGPELILRIDRDSEIPLRSQLESGLREAVRGGRLQVGERLPSSRELARELGVSRGLVQECYGQLQAEGYLASQVGSATRVAMAASEPRSPVSTASRTSAPGLIADFRSAVPDLASFPRNDWVWATREACRRVSNLELDYLDPRGSLVLRAVLAAYQRRVRAAVTDQNHIVICAGFAQGIRIVVEVLRRSGVDCIAFEDPGPGSAAMSETVRVAVAAGMRVAYAPVDDRGIDVAALDTTGARLVVVTPAHQSPTGVVLSAERRQALVAWAQRKDAYVIEDDYDSEFRYDREPLGVVQGLAPDRVFTIGTVSKSLAPAVRLGWVITPPRWLDDVAQSKRLSDRGSSTLDQFALAMLLESGRYDRHLRRMRACYRHRRDVLVGALSTLAPGVELSGLAAGFHAVANLADAADQHAIVSAARLRGVGLYGMDLNRADGSASPPRLVLGFGNVADRAIEPGIAAIADLLR